MYTIHVGTDILLHILLPLDALLPIKFFMKLHKKSKNLTAQVGKYLGILMQTFEATNRANARQQSCISVKSTLNIGTTGNNVGNYRFTKPYIVHNR